jgi:hypothetical protein
MSKQDKKTPAAGKTVPSVKAKARRVGAKEGGTPVPVAVVTETFVVSGRVSSSDRAGVGGLRVEVVDKNVGADVSLVQGVTDAAGNYSLQFAAAQVTRQGKTAPDVQVRVLAGETLLAVSVVRYNAGASEVINVVLPVTASAALPSEHETLTGALAVHFKGSLRDLKETAGQQDITYLANKSGWDARAVALASLADQFSKASAPSPTTPGGGAGVPPAFYYALFRAGLPANDTLYHTDAQTVTGVWKRAVGQGVIPRMLENDIPKVQQAFQALSAQKILTLPPAAGVSTLADMLGASGLNVAQQQQFASLYAAHRTDLNTFWKAAGDTFGKDAANRLQVSGKLAFLTRNNAPLMQRLQKVVGANGLSDPLQLAQAGYHRVEKWNALLNANTPIPKEIPGATAEIRRGNYAQFLAAQVRLSYPTATVAEMVKSGDLKVDVPDQISKFLTDHQGRFEIGAQPVQQYIARNKLAVPGAIVAEVNRLQRVFQITTSDQAMGALLKNGMHAAYHIVRVEREAFIQKFAGELGGADDAAGIYDQAVQVHHAVLNVAVSYITARSNLQLGASPLLPPAGNAGAPRIAALALARPGRDGQVLQPAPTGATADNADDVIAYPTLESLFGSMDFCACDECRSVLSPAAYLVDLLQFIDQAPTEAGRENPQAVLLERRPDLQHLPLTCENTNTALPYIDVVIETLEYYIANASQPLSLKNYTGHDTDGSDSADLLASPQFVMDTAYTILRGERFPSQLPFHQPLETLRRYFLKFEIPLPVAMERLRTTDDLERGVNPYGWRDILAEELEIARNEYDLLTNSALTLKQIYGFAAGKTDAQVTEELSNAKKFSRRAEISYQDLVSLLETRFINPQSDLIPKLSKLGVTIATLKALHDGTMTDAAFDALLPQGSGAPDKAEYGDDIKAWVKNNDNFNRMMGLITLTNPTATPDPCDFDQLEFRFAKPMAGPGDNSTRLSTVEFVRMLRFIRLWKKTGWTMEQTDAAICALYRADLAPAAIGDLDTVAKLDTGFGILLPRMGILSRVVNSLGLTPKRDLLSLLACWSDIGTQGDSALYRQMFLNPAVSQRDPDFTDKGFGVFLGDNAKKLKDHAETLRAAFSITGDEFDRILAALGFDSTTPLTLPNISAVYRRGWLAHKLRLSVRELLLLTALTGLDPFAAPDLPTAADSAILRLIALVQSMKGRSLKSAVALYLIWNQDLSGKSAPTAAQVTEFARTLRGDFAAIADQFAATEDPGGDIARARMTLVYGQAASDAFFALLDNTLVLDVAYTHSQPTLEPAITAIDANLSYDDFRHRLAHTGLPASATQIALKAGRPAAFQAAVDALFARSEDARGSFFALHPELQPLYDAYIASVDPPAVKRSKLLADFSPELSRRRKQQQAVQRLSTAAVADLAFTQSLVNPPGAPYPLHAAANAGQPALNDALAVETPGLAAQFFFRNTATGAVDQASPAEASLDYSVAANPLPVQPALSAIWRGLVETPEAGFYNIIIEADAGSAVTLSLDGQARPLVRNGSLFRNNAPIELKAGTLCEVVLTVEKLKDRLSVKWETPKRPREVIPGRYLYPPSILAPFRDAYVRFLKVTSLAAGLSITANELVRFAVDPDYQINGDGWLNALPAGGDPAPLTAAGLLKPFEALLAFAAIKADVSPADEQLLAALQDPATATATANSPMFSLLRWDQASLASLLSRFGGAVAGLQHFDLFHRVYRAFGLVQAMGISAAALINATTNDPGGGTVRDFQSAMRARYDAAGWRDIIQPINNDMRSLQRDALVAYILHQMRENPATEQIDTADKLFEYFLMDVQMEPCMQTSRIRHALSSAQLFIERCLMNLEPRVSPAAINAKQWEWMKRYRVWEANRKVFLYPENWLEPELRDDKSPFFKEIESELLQSDITEDSATTALLNYLSKLEEVAKLEPCGFFYQEADPAKRIGEINHVIARTAGAHRKYYYRRYDGGAWTPWEQVKLEIEDNPVAPVVWNGRLLLFWLRIMKKGPDSALKPVGLAPGAKLGDMGTGNIPEDPLVTVQAVLCWSEYYNGKWQPTKTSDIDAPEALTTMVAQSFDRSQVRLSFFEEGDALRVEIFTSGYGSFLLYNTHSLPVREEEVPTADTSTLHGRRDRWFIGDSQNSFGFGYGDDSVIGPVIGLPRDILKPDLAFDYVMARHKLKDPWNGPIFYEDSRHVFYVTTSEKPVFIRDYSDFGVAFNAGVLQAAQTPPLVLEKPPEIAVIPQFFGDGGPVGPDPREINVARVQQFITEDAYIRQGIGATGTVTFGDRQIGPSGSLPNKQAVANFTTREGR